MTTRNTDTATIIAQARALRDAVSSDSYSRVAMMARDAANAMIDAVLLRDLNAARKAAGEREIMVVGHQDDERAPQRYTEQSDWRDYYGWICSSERTAQWVAKWINRYLDPRDSDNNPLGERVHAISANKGSQGFRMAEVDAEGNLKPNGYKTTVGQRSDVPARWLAVSGAYKVGD